MTTQFKILFTVNIAHRYYNTGCKDFDFVFPADTAQLFRNGKLLAKVREGVLYVLFEADEAGLPLIPIAERKLRIGLKLLNPFFSNFTDLTLKVDEKILLYQNTRPVNALSTPKNAVLVGALFRHLLTRNRRPVTVTLKDSTEQSLATGIITADQNATDVPFDLTGKDAGAYTVEETYSSSSRPVRVFLPYYLDTELLQLGVFGVIEIDIKSTFYRSTPAFNVRFNAKGETLKYYVIAKNYTDVEFNRLSVTDVVPIAGGRPLLFSKLASTAFTANEISPALLLGNGGGKLVLFQSQGVVRQEKARKNIQLSNNGNVLVTHLPQPSTNRPNSDLIIHVSKP